MGNGLHYVNAEEFNHGTADLRFNYLTKNGNRAYIKCNTIMDFIDEMEYSDYGIPSIDSKDVHAKFFDNKLNTKEFNTVGELLEHCKRIVK